MAVEACGAPPVRLRNGAGDEYTQFCARTSRLWDVTKGDHKTQLQRCDHHAAGLRGNGYDVRLAQPAGSTGPKRKWDMTSMHSLEAGAEWFRGNSQALVVIVLRAGDGVVAVDAGIPAAELNQYLFRGLPEALAQLERNQEEERAKQVHKQIRSGVNPEGRHV